MAQEKSCFEHRSSHIYNPGENVAHAQPSVAQEEDEIQNSNFEHKSSKHQVAPKRIKQEPEDKPLRWTQEEQTEEPPHQSPDQTRRTIKQYSQSIFLLEKMVKKILM